MCGLVPRIYGTELTPLEPQPRIPIRLFPEFLYDEIDEGADFGGEIAAVGEQGADMAVAGAVAGEDGDERAALQMLVNLPG